MLTLRLGSRGQDVRVLQGYLALHVDGIFGRITQEAVKDFQTRHSLSPDGICGPKTWEALGCDPQSRVIKKIILHCTATPEGTPVSVSTVRKWHLACNFSDIGYHYLVGLDGSVEPGRPESVIGAHTTGQNTCSIGIAYVGGLASDGKTPKDTRTPQQKQALHRLVAELLSRYPGATIHGHYEFANKDCPCFKICDF